MNNVPLKLMQGLYFPAVVGTGLVVTLFKIGEMDFANAFKSIKIWFGFLLVIYFSLSFLANEELQKQDETSEGESKKKQEQKYTWTLFSIDFLETTAVFTAFYFLGFLTDNGVVNERMFYCALAFAPALHLIWNRMAYQETPLKFTVLSALRLLLLIVGFIIGHTKNWYFTFTFFSFLVLTVAYCLVKFGNIDFPRRVANG